MFACVCIYLYGTFLLTYIHSTHMYIYIHIHIHVYLYTEMHMYMYMYLYIHTYVYIYISLKRCCFLTLRSKPLPSNSGACGLLAGGHEEHDHGHAAAVVAEGGAWRCACGRRVGRQEKKVSYCFEGFVWCGAPRRASHRVWTRCHARLHKLSQSFNCILRLIPHIMQTNYVREFHASLHLLCTFPSFLQEVDPYVLAYNISSAVLGLSSTEALL